MKMTINKNGRKFIIYTHWIGSAMLDVSIWEEKHDKEISNKWKEFEHFVNNQKNC